MKATFSGLEPWALNSPESEISTPLGTFDLHGDCSFLGFGVDGHPKARLALRFGTLGREFAIQFEDVGQLFIEQDAVSSDGWFGTPETSPEGIETILYYEYGSELPPVFEIVAATFRFKFRAWRVAFSG
ncbi:hypothetical protein [Kitasatospora sp. KL5]|uniref:hypothetical protein n=1 Tax=Kitasatospora sp. KL5 TaxID=3425125 RepID=UPI003D6E4870